MLLSNSFLTMFNYVPGSYYNVTFRGQQPLQYKYQGYIDHRFVFSRMRSDGIKDIYRFAHEPEYVLITAIIDI